MFLFIAYNGPNYVYRFHQLIDVLFIACFLLQKVFFKLIGNYMPLIT